VLVTVVLLSPDAAKLPDLTEFQRDWEWAKSQAEKDRATSKPCTDRALMASLRREIELRKHVWVRCLDDARRGRWMDLARRAWAAIRARWRTQTAQGSGTATLTVLTKEGTARHIDGRKKRKLPWLGEAMLLVQEHPDWSDRQIALQVRSTRRG